VEGNPYLIVANVGMYYFRNPTQSSGDSGVKLVQGGAEEGDELVFHQLSVDHGTANAVEGGTLGLKLFSHTQQSVFRD
jgi:hypothetical protein